MKTMRFVTCGIVIGLSLAGLATAHAQSKGTILAPAAPSLTAPATSTTATTTSTTPSAATDTLNGIDSTGQKTAPLPTQGLNLGTKDTAHPPSIDPKDIPQVLMDEMKEVETNCKNNFFFSSFHDCRCIGVKFLDARLKTDPNTPKERVLESVAVQCTDEASIAGFVYKSCSDYMKNTRKDYVQFCKCSANNVATTYAKTPVMNLRYIEGLRRNAFIACGIRNNPDAVMSPYNR